MLYMKIAGDVLKVLFLHMLYIVLYMHSNELLWKFTISWWTHYISNAKKLLLKAPSCVQKLKSHIIFAHDPSIYWNPLENMVFSCTRICKKNTAMYNLERTWASSEVHFLRSIAGISSSLRAFSAGIKFRDDRRNHGWSYIHIINRDSFLSGKSAHCYRATISHENQTCWLYGASFWQQSKTYLY